MSKLGFRVCLLLAAPALFLTGGCGRSGPERHEITGKVTYGGRPVDDGVIDFEPQDGQGTKDGAQIQKDGTYRIPRDKGLVPGKYKVSIYIGDGYDTPGGAGPDAPKRPGAGKKQGKERAPAEFNTKSNLIRGVTREGPNKFDFDIP